MYKNEAFKFYDLAKQVLESEDDTSILYELPNRITFGIWLSNEILFEIIFERFKLDQYRFNCLVKTEIGFESILEYKDIEDIKLAKLAFEKSYFYSLEKLKCKNKIQK